MKMDLHSHSNFSDGELSIEEILTKSINAKLDYISITDHDDYRSFTALKNYKNLNIKTILGMEFSTIYKGKSIHVLAYFKDETYLTNEIKDLINGIKLSRSNRAVTFIENLNKFYSLDLDYKEILEKYNVITRAHLAKEITHKQNISIDEAFDKYLSESNKAYISSSKLSTLDCVKKLINAKALICLAHPALIERNLLVELLNEVHFDALECIHPSNKEGDYEFFLTLLPKYNLIKTAGSDFHRMNDKKHAPIGTCYIEGIDSEIFIERLEKS